MVAETRRPAAMTDDIGATAAKLAALSVEPTLARSVAAAATISGAGMRNDIGDLRSNPRQRVSPPSRHIPRLRVTYRRFVLALKVWL